MKAYILSQSNMNYQLQTQTTKRPSNHIELKYLMGKNCRM